MSAGTTVDGDALARDPEGRRRSMGPAELHRCRACGRYTLEEACPECHGPAGNPHPARWSPEDRYARYRRALLAEAAAQGSGTPEGQGGVHR